MSSLSFVTNHDRWIDLSEKERVVEQRENTILESFDALEEQRSAIRGRVQRLRTAAEGLDAESPERAAIESGLIGFESVGEDLEQTFEPLLELRDEWVQKREALCAQVADDVSRMTDRLARAMQALEGLAERADEAERAAASDASEPVAAPVAVAQPPVEPSMAEAAEARPSDEIINLEARVTQESEDNFWSGLDAGSGVFVSTIDLLPLGQRVHITVEVEGANRVSAHGVVRWFRDWDDDQPQLHPGMGVELQDLDESNRHVIDEFMSRRDPWLFV